MKTDSFQSCGHCWVFQICWHIESSTFTASSFRIWNSSTGIPSLPLALFVVMLPKSLLTSHSRMSGSRWVITPSWLYGSWRSFLCAYWVSDISYVLWQMITGNHMYSYAHKNTSMLRNPAWSYQAKFFSWAKSMQAKLLTEEPHFYVPLPNPNLIHHLPSQMYILSYILYLFFFFFSS